MASTTVNKGSDKVAASSDSEVPFSPVYLLHSNKTLGQLETFLGAYGDVGFMRIMYDGDGRETDRTIAVLPTSTYNTLSKEGYSKRQYGKDFVISVFNLRDSHYPGEGRTKSLFIPIPEALRTSETFVVESINDSLRHLAEWKIVPEDSWSVNVPIQSRETGGVRGSCFVSFRRDVTIHEIAMARVLLTDTYWPEREEDAERILFHCYWARDRKERPSRPRKERPAKVVDPAAPPPPVLTKEEKEARKEEARKKSLQRDLDKFAKTRKAAPPKKAPAMPAAPQPTLKSTPATST